MIQWAVFTQISYLLRNHLQIMLNLYKNGYGVDNVSLSTALGTVIKTKALAPRA